MALAMLSDLDKGSKLYLYRVEIPLWIGFEEGDLRTVYVSSQVQSFNSRVTNHTCVPERHLVELSVNPGESVGIRLIPVFINPLETTLPDYGEEFTTTRGSYGMVERLGLQLPALRDHWLTIQDGCGNGDESYKPYVNWTQKEIHEQPTCLSTLLESVINNTQSTRFDGISEIAAVTACEHLVLAGCGSSLNACLFASQLFRRTGCFVTVTVINASEYDSNEIPRSELVCVVVLSQSGETKDCKNLIRVVQKRAIPYLTIVNAPFSWLTVHSKNQILLQSKLYLAQ
jgi:D-arabinose 5-phosphate isomerase GutQ